VHLSEGLSSCSFVDLLTENSASSLLRQLDESFGKWEEELARADRHPTHAPSPTKKRKPGAKSKGAAAAEEQDQQDEALELYKRIRLERYSSTATSPIVIFIMQLIAVVGFCWLLRTWRDVALKFLDDSENQIFLDASEDNIFWRNQTLIVRSHK
jgi:hypothetical protein